MTIPSLPNFTLDTSVNDNNDENGDLGEVQDQDINKIEHEITELIEDNKTEIFNDQNSKKKDEKYQDLEEIILT